MFAPLFSLFVLLYGIQAWPHEGKACTEQNQVLLPRNNFLILEGDAGALGGDRCMDGRITGGSSDVGTDGP
jgi:hypothetical protein